MNKLDISDEEYQNLLVDYDAGIKTTEIIKKYNLTIKLNQLNNYIDPLESDIKCPYCDCFMVIPKRKRMKIGYGNILYCPQCSHEDIMFCNCLNCTENKEAMLQLEWNTLATNIYTHNVNLETPINFSDLTTADQLWILSFIRSLTLEHFNQLSLSNKTYPIYPNENKINEKIETFLKRGLFRIVDIKKNIKSFAYDGEIKKEDIVYELNIKPSALELYDLFQTKNNLTFDTNEITSISKTLLFDEVYELIKINMESIKGQFKPGEKTRYVVEKIIDTYDYLTIAKIIWSVSSKTLRYGMDHACSKNQTYNRFISNLEDYLEQVKKHNWQISPSAFRPPKCPETSFRTILNKYYNPLSTDVLT